MNQEIASWVAQQKEEVLSILQNCGIDQEATAQ